MNQKNENISLLTVSSFGLGNQGLSESVRQRHAKILARHVQSAFDSIPVTVVSNTVILFILIATLIDSAPHEQLVIWAAATLATLAFLHIIRRNYRADAERDTRRVRHWAWMIGLSSDLRGLAWGGGTIAFFPGMTPNQQLVLGLTAAAMMCGGAFALGSMPVAAIVFILFTGGASIIALLLTGSPEMLVLSVLTAIFMVFLWASVINHARIFVSHATGEISNAEQRQTIGLLLKEFQDNSADWLWHTDSNGYFVDPSTRFVAVSGRTAGALTRARFQDVFSAEASVANKKAIEVFQQRGQMTGIEVTIDVGGERRYWSLTAGPSHDEHGTFLGYRGAASDVTELRAASARLETLAHFDQLTGLPNRASFIEDLNDWIAEAGPEGIGIVLIDLTGFKLVNDTLGHGVGDELLARLGERLAGLETEDRLFARLGGDEFALLVKAYPSPAELRSSADEVLSLFTIPFAIGPHNVVIDASAGIALGGRDGTDAVTLMRAADVALYAAKATGRGLWLEYSEEMASAYLRRQNLERGLRDAIANRELSLRFQPVMSVRSGRVSAVEALLRWNSAEFGAVEPTEFIPIAEDCGLIVPIGNWVLREATRTCAAFSEDIEVCVNVSPVQMRNKKLVQAVRSSLKTSGLAPERLVLEITEGVFLERSVQTDRTLNELVALGAQISLDDFGTGYSSLSYLRSFPFAKLKIDKSFVDDVAVDGPTSQIVKTIVELATALGFDVVAEGVETHSQLAEIVRLGCGYVQGYLFAKPLLTEEVEAFMADNAADNPSALTAEPERQIG